MVKKIKENPNNTPERTKTSVWSRAKNFMQRLVDTFNSPSNEEAWNRFPEEAKKEMLESLKKKDNFNLYSINITEMGDFVSTMSMGDTIDFKKGIVQKDKIGKYIVINGIKCREYQPGISGFVYKDVRDRYHPSKWLTIGFCDKGLFQKQVNINDFGEIESIDLPRSMEKLLGGPFYATDNQHSIEEGPLSKVSRDDLFSPIKEEEEIITSNRKETHTYSDNWERNKEGNSLTINGVEFKPFKTGISGFIYQEIINPLDNSKSFLLAEYKDGKMIGNGVIVNPNNKVYITSKDNLTKTEK